MIKCDQKCSKVVEESRARQLRLKGLVLDSEMTQMTLELTKYHMLVFERIYPSRNVPIRETLNSTFTMTGLTCFLGMLTTSS